jgi:hypothetical protein
MSQNFCPTHIYLLLFSFYRWSFKQYESTVVKKLACWQEHDGTFIVHTWPIQFLNFLHFASLDILYHSSPLFILFSFFLFFSFTGVSFIILCLFLLYCTFPVSSISFPVKSVFIMPFHN